MRRRVWCGKAPGPLSPPWGLLARSAQPRQAPALRAPCCRARGPSCCRWAAPRRRLARRRSPGGAKASLEMGCAAPLVRGAVLLCTAPRRARRPEVQFDSAPNSPVAPGPCPLALANRRPPMHGASRHEGLPTLMGPGRLQAPHPKQFPMAGSALGGGGRAAGGVAGNLGTLGGSVAGWPARRGRRRERLSAPRSSAVPSGWPRRSTKTRRATWNGSHSLRRAASASA